MASASTAEPKRGTKRKRHFEEITLQKHANFNREITEKLQEMATYEKNRGQMNKFKAYGRAIRAIAMHPTKITSGKEATKLEGVGKKIAAKIDEILETGDLKKLQALRSDDKVQAVDLFTKISGVGPAAAHKWVYEDGLRTLDDLKKVSLNHHQQIGLKYFNELQQRIPRAEMVLLSDFVTRIIHSEVDKDIIVRVCGSFRRGAASSGDLDILITHPRYMSKEKTTSKLNILQRIVDKLRAKKFLTDDISFGNLKYMGICQLPESELPKQTASAGDEGSSILRLHRRIDLRLIPYDNFWCGLLYFTGSDFFNQQMRNIALERGFTLSEYNIRPVGETGIPGDPIHVNSEEEIFEILGMEYKEPAERDL